MAEEKKSVKFNLDNEIIPPVDKSKAPSVSGSDGTPVRYPSSAEVQPLRPEVQLKVPISPEDRQSVDDFHRLLAARQRALQLIGQAKQDKAVNLKRAQKEVQDDIDEYRAGMEVSLQPRAFIPNR
jgi:Vacuolar (H+)-ATPase G subunit.